MSEEEDPKGLFTFYKEQEAENPPPPPPKQRNKRKKKKRSQKALPKLPPPSPPPPPLPQQEDSYQHFLKNVVMQHGKKDYLKAEMELLVCPRVKTEPIAPKQAAPNQTQLRKRREENSKERDGNKEEREKERTASLQSMKKISQLNSLTKQIERARGGMSNRSEMLERAMVGERRQAGELQVSFLERLKFLEVKSKSNLINSESKKEGLHYEHKKYFKHLMSNFYVHAELQNQYAYKLLRDTLRLPQLPTQDHSSIKDAKETKEIKDHTSMKDQPTNTKDHQVKTKEHTASMKQPPSQPKQQQKTSSERQSPRACRKEEDAAIKYLKQKLKTQGSPTTRIELFRPNSLTRENKIKHSDSKHRELFKLNRVAELTESQNSQQSAMVSLIDLSKEYHPADQSRAEWLAHRKIIKSRLGVEL